jgi:phage host-nuclease inhibitor protein Gam
MTNTELDPEFDPTALCRPFLDVDEPDDENGEPPVRDDEWAARTMRIVRAIDRRITRIDAQREAHIAAAKAEADAFEATLYDTLVHRVEGLRGALEAWAIEQRARDPRAPATIEFPAGVIKTRKLDRWTWPEKDADLVASLKAMKREDLIRTKESPAKDGIKAEAFIKDGAVVLSGELLAGVTVETGALIAEVKVS